mmetsp:Transcript_94441/g.197290  ORF Transcript_94441/g.197290 Transcript_94441/m.197290 type:complete len:160 (+) Transcript_94441:778-1257(+)
MRMTHGHHRTVQECIWKCDCSPGRRREGRREGGEDEQSRRGGEQESRRRGVERTKSPEQLGSTLLKRIKAEWGNLAKDSSKRVNNQRHDTPHTTWQKNSNQFVRSLPLIHPPNNSSTKGQSTMKDEALRVFAAAVRMATSCNDRSSMARIRERRSRKEV